MKKRKRKKLRDKFTDALGEEILARKIVDKTQPKPKVDLTKKNKPKPKVKVEPKVENLSKVEEVKIVEVEVDAEFEKKVFAEADNDFHDEKPKRPKRSWHSEDTAAPSRSSFRTRAMVEKIAEENLGKHLDKKNIDPDADLRRKLTRAETVGAALSAIMLVYSLSTLDKPLFFMALSLFTHTLRPLIGGFFGKYNRPVQNALRGFSIAIFFGAIFLLFV